MGMSMLPQGVSLTDEDCYPLAEIYTGPRPLYVPKAQPLGSVPFSTRVVVSSHQSRSSPSPPRVILSSILCTSQEGFVGTLDGSPHISNSTTCIVDEQALSPSQNQASLETGDAADLDVQASLETGDAADSDVHFLNVRGTYIVDEQLLPPSQNLALLETGDAADADVCSLNAWGTSTVDEQLPSPSQSEDSLEIGDAVDADDRSLSARGTSIVDEQFPSPSQSQASVETADAADADAHSLNDRGISMEDILSSLQLHLPYPDQEDRISTQSEFKFSGRHSSSSCSSTNSPSGELQEQTLPEPRVFDTQDKRKGECFMCAKVNRMQEKVTCLVCRARFCSCCVVKAMGSMPEGRKCVRCIGQPICESRRRQLGKPTRLLNRLLSTLEVQQIMRAERESPANLLRPEQVIVNRKELTGKEFALLLGCEKPPSKLKPGRYWYDGQCGYWGKEGEKPDKIITINLKVGGELQEAASAGCTKVYINEREITKIELRMLKLAGVQCPPQTHLWLNPDGTYQEAGHGHCPGNLWEKARVRSFCYLFSLPMPNSRAVAPEPSRPVLAYCEPKIQYKILLLGHAGCGTNTIIKQAKLLYKKKFTSKELQDIKALIQRNIYKYIIILLEARERFEDEENAIRTELEENTPSSSTRRESSNIRDVRRDAGEMAQSVKTNVFTLSARLKDQADWFLRTDASGELEKYYFAVTREHASLIEELWKDSAIQATYKRRAELHRLPDVAGHFLDRVVEISSNDYSPSEHDILRAEGATHESGLAEIDFCMDGEDETSGAYNEQLDQPLRDVRFHLIRIGGKGIADGSKVLKMFDDVQAVVFCVALDCYDQMWSDTKGPLQNKMILSRDFFGSILNHPSFKDKRVVVFFNKYDAFEEKVCTKPLPSCEWFSDFHPVKSSNSTPEVLAQYAYTYIAYMFKKHYEMVNPTGGKLYTFQLKGLEGASVSNAFQYLKSIVVCEEMKKHEPPLSSFYTETSSLNIDAPRR